MSAFPPDWRSRMARERASLARHTNERADRMTAEYHAATEHSRLPQPPRHRGVTLPDNAPDAWEVDGE